jgi:hypothetical protein
MNSHRGSESEGRGAMSEEAGRRTAGPVGLRPVPDAQAMADAALRELVERARRITEAEEEPLRSIAFRVVLEQLLRGGTNEEPEQPLRSGGRPAQAPPATDLPVAEFLAQRRIDSHPDRVVGIAYYHYHRHGGQGVTTKDLVDAYAKSRARRPQNYPDVIASCVRRGYLIDGGRRDSMKTWVITRTGESHVEQDL